MRAFLQYITENAILGRSDKLKEQTIGTEVLGRPADYNPTDDNIVRVRAHELRGRLERYFSSEGTQEPFIITIPRGAYAPEFVHRQAESAVKRPVSEESPAAVSTAVPDTAPEVVHVAARRQWPGFAALLIAAVVLSAAVTHYLEPGQVASGFPKPATSLKDFWGQFFERPGAELKVVYADTSFALW